MSRSIAITGVGTLGSFGVGYPALAELLEGGEPRLHEVDRSGGFHVAESATRAGLIKDLAYQEWIPPMIARRLSPPSRFAVIAARLALEDAGIGLSQERDPSTAVVLSTSFGPSSFTQRLLDQIFHEGPEAISPFLFAECVANAPSAQVAIQTRSTGPNHTLCESEAGPLISVGQGAAQIVSGRAERCLAGAVEEMSPLLHAILDRFGALARGDGAARPFERRRNGFIAAEGATVLVLEPEEQARGRGARLIARLRGWSSGFDRSASRVGWGTGAEVLAAGLRRCLDRGGLRPEDIDLVVAGASGSRAGDLLEARVLREAWNGAALPPIVTPKAVTGEYGGGFLAAAVLATGGYVVRRGTWFEDPDPESGITPAERGSVPARGKVLVSNLATGGCGAWLVLENV